MKKLSCLCIQGVYCFLLSTVQQSLQQLTTAQNCKGGVKMHYSLGNFAINSLHDSSSCLLSKRTINFHLTPGCTLTFNHDYYKQSCFNLVIKIPKTLHVLQGNPHCSTETAGQTEQQLLQEEQVGLRARSLEYNRVIS